MIDRQKMPLRKVIDPADPHGLAALRMYRGAWHAAVEAPNISGRQIAMKPGAERAHRHLIVRGRLLDSRHSNEAGRPRTADRLDRSNERRECAALKRRPAERLPWPRMCVK